LFDAAVPSLSVLRLIPPLNDDADNDGRRYRSLHICANSREVCSVLQWPDDAAAVVAARAQDMWKLEEFVSGSYSEPQPQVEFKAVDVAMSVAKGLALAGLDAKHLEGVRAHVALLNAAAPGDCRQPSPLLPHLYGSSPQIVSLSANWTEAITRGGCNASLAALVGVCAGRAPCKDSAAALWLMWSDIVRELGRQQLVSGNGKCNTESAEALAMTCVAPFLTNARSVPGEHASRALRVLALVSDNSPSNAVTFAALSIGLDPGMDAMKNSDTALNFVAAVAMLPTVVCQRILRNLQLILEQK
jgi:hypothetical protein